MGMRNKYQYFFPRVQSGDPLAQSPLGSRSNDWVLFAHLPTRLRN